MSCSKPASRRHTLDLHAVHGEFLAKDPLGGVLRDRGEAERNVGRRGELHLCDLFAVDPYHLAEHLDSCVEDPVQHPHALEYLERTRLYANGFGILRGIGDGVDDPEVDSSTGEFDRRRQSDGASACYEHVGVSHECDYAAAMSIEAPSGSKIGAGHLIARRLRASGIDTIFTLSGGHLFSIYDGCRAEGVRLIDTRHEQTAAFAAEGWSKVTRVPGVAALTAGPGVTNGMSAMAAAQQNQSPLLVLGGRAPALRWGQGSLQEIDHVPFVAPLTRFAATAQSADAVGGLIDDALRATVGADGTPTGVRSSTSRWITSSERRTTRATRVRLRCHRNRFRPTVRRSASPPVCSPAHSDR